MAGIDNLFFADAIIDIDIGIFNLIKKEYNKEGFVNPNIKFFNDKFIKSYLVEECTDNIMRLLIHPDKINNADKIYKELLETKYKEIVDLSPTTDILKLVVSYSNYKSSTNITPVIVCKNKVEEEYLKRLDFNTDIVLIEDYSKIILEPYTRIILRDIRDIHKIGIARIRGKNLLILKYRFNFEKDKDKEQYLLIGYTVISDINIFEISFPYIDIDKIEG